jgi:GNAT superfamily N-acetyltransferase
MNPSVKSFWRAMLAPDLAAVCDLSTSAHPNYPERPEVLAEKFQLFPQGCFTLTEGYDVRGYCFSHPWRKGQPPSLDSFLNELPKDADSYFIHDLTLDASMRRKNLAAALVPDLVRTAQDTRLSRMTLVAVNGSSPFWSRFGFRPTPDASIQDAARAKYDAGAIHMQRSLG